MDEAGVDRAVIIPPDWPGYRNDYALEAAKRYPRSAFPWFESYQAASASL